MPTLIPMGDLQSWPPEAGWGEVNIGALIIRTGFGDRLHKKYKRNT